MSILLEALLDAHVSEDERQGRVYGLMFGIVTEANDPKKLGRIKARMGAQGASDSTDWLVPLWPGGIESTPKANDPVFIQFVDGDPHRGCYLAFAQSNTKDRPSDFMLLGTTFAGLYNDLVTKFNQLLTQLKTHQHPVPSFGTSGAPVPPAFVSITNAGQIKAGDGSTVPPKSGDQVALSTRAKVGK